MNLLKVPIFRSGLCRLVTMLVFVIAAVALAGTAFSQVPTKPKKKKKDAPDPETVTIVTKDGVELRADFFGGIHEKNTLPVMILHEFDGDRKGLLPLAEYLQKEHGHAVLVPDLRGHGESITVQGGDEPIDRKRFKKNEMASMYEDLESCKRFLMRKNNDGELNIDMLTVIAMGTTSIHAVRWSIADWDWPTVGGLKQGQDVKALVLVSPVKRFKSLSMTQDLKNSLMSGKGAAPLPVFLTWGSRNDESAKEGKSIYNAMNKSRPEVDPDAKDDAFWREKSLFRVIYKSKESGSKLVDDQPDRIFDAIGLFFEKKVLAYQEDFRWQNRERK